MEFSNNEKEILLSILETHYNEVKDSLEKIRCLPLFNDTISDIENNKFILEGIIKKINNSMKDNIDIFE